MKQRKKQKVAPLLVIFAFVATPVLIIDQVTKAWALSVLEVGAPTRPLIGGLIGLQLVRNPGAAFSLAESFTWVFSLIAMTVLGIIIWSGRAMTNLAWQLSLGLLAGGGPGNPGGPASPGRRGAGKPGRPAYSPSGNFSRARD